MLESPKTCTIQAARPNLPWCVGIVPFSSADCRCQVARKPDEKLQAQFQTAIGLLKGSASAPEAEFHNVLQFSRTWKELKPLTAERSVAAQLLADLGELAMQRLFVDVAIADLFLSIFGACRRRSPRARSHRRVDIGKVSS